MKSSTYKSWDALKSRCCNPNNHAYPNYGGRGITVCPEWLESYQNFLRDMGEKPRGMTIDRIDNDGNYEKSNCRWVTKADQNRNKQYHLLITFDGKTQPLFQWVQDLNLNYYTVHSRLRKGQPPEEALMGTAPRKLKGNLRAIRHKNDILDVLPAEWFTRKHVIAITGKDRETVREALDELVVDGVLEAKTVLENTARPRYYRRLR